MPLPPAQRSSAARGLTAAARAGCFALQVCRDCGAVQYPPREACHVCLRECLEWRAQDGAAELIAATTLHHSHHPYFAQRLPWRIGMARLDAGPTVLAHLHERCPPAPSRVRIGARLDKSGQGVLIAFPDEGEPTLHDDSRLRELTCAVRDRQVLVTQGDSPLGQALVRALIEAGARQVWLASANPLEREAAPAQVFMPRTSVVSLDPAREDSVVALARQIGDDIDILIHDTPAASEPVVTEGESTSHLDLLRLTQAFAPRMGAAGSTARGNAVAWVNLFCERSVYGASPAAAHALSLRLRAQLQPAGVRVLHVIHRPLSAQVLARAVIEALGDAIEEVYPGEPRETWLARQDLR
jgi:uncharacterized OB-fold protein/NADP-dependent 3-hydroxy acid dehydrogenase YdfG